MREIKCPKCGEVFQVDESGYAAIVKQVRDSEFKREIDEHRKHFESEIKSAVDIAVAKVTSEKDAEIAELVGKAASAEKDRQIAVGKVTSEKDAEIAELKSRIASAEKDAQIAVSDAVAERQKTIDAQKDEIHALTSKLTVAQVEREQSEKSIKDRCDVMIKLKDEEIERLRDYKMQQSTKMIGESLERHCEDEFNKLRPAAFRTAYFEKDNDASGGSKGDFIFRDFDENGTEFISIMFEMKNEAEDTAASTKKRNADFLAKLDKDRREKNCEYAVLVSMLEPDSELYNYGIVDVSYRYPKMYVIRPQFFTPLITLLRNAALETVYFRRALAEERARNLDVTHFEERLNDFKDQFGRNYELAHRKFDEAIEEIDKTISHLEKVKQALRSSGNNLRIANKKLEDVTIKRLTRGNPTMAAKFAELKEGGE